MFVGVDGEVAPLFAIIHPPGFTGMEDHLQINVCTGPTAGDLDPFVQNALVIWNQLLPMTGNCVKCERAENVPLTPPHGALVTTTIIHELGHGAMGLGHPNLTESGIATSFTNSLNFNGINSGADGIRGSSDDLLNPIPGSRLIHWFRFMGANPNNPVGLHSTTIDQNSFTRRILDLPSGHNWVANAYSDYVQLFPADDVADLLGFPDTQSVVNTTNFREQVFLGLSQDDVDTVRFGMTGMNKIANDSDDYTFQLVFEANCALAQIEISKDDPRTDIDLEVGQLGISVFKLIEIPESGQVTQHFAIGPASPNLRVRIKINDNIVWQHEVDVFDDGFESGNTSAWSSTVP